MHPIRKILKLALGGATWFFGAVALAESGGAQGGPLTAGGLGSSDFDPAALAGALALIVAAVLAFYGVKART